MDIEVIHNTYLDKYKKYVKQLLKHITKERRIWKLKNSNEGKT